MKVLLDSSVLLPALVERAPGHHEAAPHLHEIRRGATRLYVAAHALAECYSSLTTLPTRPTPTPGQARRLIERNVVGLAEEIIPLVGEDYRAAIERMTEQGLVSGAIYDCLHVIAAERAGVDELRTFNGRDFRRMPPRGDTRLVVL